MLQVPSMPWVVVLYPAVTLVYVAAGLAAWTRRPSSRLGLIMVFGGGVWLLAGMANIDSEALAAVGAIARILGIAVIVHLLLSFPTGRLRGRIDRLVVAGAYFSCLILEIPNWLWAPSGALSLADRPELVDTGVVVLRMAAGVVVASTVAILVSRTRRMSPEQRHVFAPLSFYGIFTLLLILVADEIANRAFDGGGLVLPAIQLSVVALVPVAFAAAASRGGFARTADIAELGTWLADEESSRSTLRQALADALGDPSLQLLFRLPGDDTLVDERGAAIRDPEPESTRGMVEIELAGDPVGAIVYDSVLLDRPEAVREAGRVIALALDRERLVVELRASRTRLVASADEARHQIARDLHDGLQSRLIFLAVQAGTGADRKTIRSGIETAINELRDLVDGVMPVQLTERGLPDAVEDLADRMPTPTTLKFVGFDTRLATEVETAAYFIVSEAMVNAVKHSGSSSLAVTLERSDGNLSIEVVDDGIGEARLDSGVGMRGMDDRVAALGGQLAVTSTSDGTRVTAVIPYPP